MRSDAPARPAEPERLPAPPFWPTQVLDALEQAVVALDRERRVVYNNRRIEELLGAETGALLGIAGARLFPGRRRALAARRLARAPRVPARGRGPRADAQGRVAADARRGRRADRLGRAGRGDLRDRGRRVPEEDRPAGLARRAVGLRGPRDPQPADRHPHHGPVRGLEVQAQRLRGARTSTTSSRSSTGSSRSSPAC